MTHTATGLSNAWAAAINPSAPKTFIEWKRRFYPIEAKHVAPEHAVLHALAKWEGMRPETLTAYNMKVVSGDLYSADGTMRLGISTISCALCQHYYNDFSCPKCPITRATGRTCMREGFCVPSPWKTWLWRQDPEPMIAVLKRTLEWEQKQ